MDNQNITKQKQQSPTEGNLLRKENKNQQVKKQEAVRKPYRPVNVCSGPGSSPKLSMEQKMNKETKFQQKSEKMTVQKRPSSGLQDVSVKCND